MGVERLCVAVRCTGCSTTVFMSNLMWTLLTVESSFHTSASWNPAPLNTRQFGQPPGPEDTVLIVLTVQTLQWFTHYFKCCWLKTDCPYVPAVRSVSNGMAASFFGGGSGGFWGTLVQLMNLLSWLETEAAAWTQAEGKQRGFCGSVGLWFPCGGPARQQCNSNNLAQLVCPRLRPGWQSRKHPPAKVFKPQRASCAYWFAHCVCLCVCMPPARMHAGLRPPLARLPALEYHMSKCPWTS